MGWVGNRYRQRAATTFIIVAALVAGCGSLTAEPEAGSEVVVIGASLELTGADSSLGTTYRNALELRVEQVNEQGLLGDRTLELRIRDNRSDPATTASTIADLASDSDVAVIVTGGCSACAIAAAELADEVAVPVIGLAAADAVSNPLDERQYAFKLGPNAGDSARALARQIDRVEAETVGVIAVDDPYADDGLRELENATPPGTVVVTEQVTSEEDSVLSAVAGVLAYQPEPDPATGFGVTIPDPPPGPDAVVISTPPTLAGQTAVALREQGFEGDLLLDSIAAGDVLLESVAGAALSGATMVFTETLVVDEIVATSPARAARKNWFRSYVARFGTYHAYSSFAADAVGTIVHAVERTDALDRDSLRAAIERAELDGLTGPLRMTPDNHSGLLPQALTMLVVTNERWRIAS